MSQDEIKMFNYPELKEPPLKVKYVFLGEEPT